MTTTPAATALGMGLAEAKPQGHHDCDDDHDWHHCTSSP
jgi:hypothetical protein